MASIVETVWAVRARMVDGSIIDLLLFASETDAEEFRNGFGTPKGFDIVNVVQRRVIGPVATVERRRLRRQ